MCTTDPTVSAGASATPEMAAAQVDPAEINGPEACCAPFVDPLRRIRPLMSDPSVSGPIGMDLDPSMDAFGAPYNCLFLDTVDTHVQHRSGERVPEPQCEYSNPVSRFPSTFAVLDPKPRDCSTATQSSRDSSECDTSEASHTTSSPPPYSNPLPSDTWVLISANVQRSGALTSVVLERALEDNVDFVLIQEPFWGRLKTVAPLSHNAHPGGDYVNTIAHSEYICLGASETAKVVTYVRRRWAGAMPRLRSDILRHDHVHLVQLDTSDGPFTVVNVYNHPDSRDALGVLTAASDWLPNISVMAGDFNLHSPLWGPDQTDRDRALHRRDLPRCMELHEFLGAHSLLLTNTPGVPTWFPQGRHADRQQAQTLDLMFVHQPLVPRILNFQVGGADRQISDHAPLALVLSRSSDLPAGRATIKPGSEECWKFVDGLTDILNSLPEHYMSPEHVNDVCTTLSENIRQLWDEHSHTPSRTKRSKTWWNAECAQAARAFRHAHRAPTSVPRDEQQRRIKRASTDLKRAVRQAKRAHFDDIIANTHEQRLWDLVRWTKPRATDVRNTFTRQDGTACETRDDIRDAFSEQFFPTTPPAIDPSFVEDLPQRAPRVFPPFSLTEMTHHLRDTPNRSAPGPDYLGWWFLKRAVHRDPHDIYDRMSILATSCVRLGVWPDVFKENITVMIPKPNKPDYSKAKAFRPIVLLNVLGKWIEKVIAARLQFDAQRYGIMHPNQFGGAIQHCTVDAGLALVHHVRSAWAKGLNTSALLFDVGQFYPSMRHDVLQGIMLKQGFSPTLCTFIGNYLQGRRSVISVQGITLDPINASLGIVQGSSLSPILSGLYLAPVIHRAVPITDVQRGNAGAQFYVDDGLVLASVPAGTALDGTPIDQLITNNAELLMIYRNIAADMKRIGLFAEPDKFELTHFRRRLPAANPAGPVLLLPSSRSDDIIAVTPQLRVRYLGFFLDPQLRFHHHVDYYVRRATLTVQALRMLGNSVRGITPVDKRRLYIANVLPVLSYGLPLYWRPNFKSITQYAKRFQKVQSMACRWITGMFRTSPIGALELLSGIIPIKFQVRKLMERWALRLRKLPRSHTLRALLPSYWSTNHRAPKVPFGFTKRTRADPAQPMPHLDRMGRRSNEGFNPLHIECRPGFRFCDDHEWRITYKLKPSDLTKADGDKFTDWLQGTFLPGVIEVNADPSALSVWTDGSLRTQNPTWRTGAAWALYQSGVRLLDGSRGCGKCSAFDAEMQGLQYGIQRAVTYALMSAQAHDIETVHNLHVYCDNESALNSIIRPDTSVHGQGCAIAACKALRRFLEADYLHNQLILHWSPGHCGVAANEHVDQLAKSAADQGLLPADGHTEADRRASIAAHQPQFLSLSYRRTQVTAESMSKWRNLAKSTHYRGSQYPKNWTSVYHTARSHPLLKNLPGRSSKHYARVCRIASGHAPIGAFRARFNLPGHVRCLCGVIPETREHIMFSCPLWIPPPVTELIIGRPQGLDDLDPFPDIYRWSRANPLAFSFELDEMRNVAHADPEFDVDHDCGQPLGDMTTELNEAILNRKSQWYNFITAPGKNEHEFWKELATLQDDPACPADQLPSLDPPTHARRSQSRSVTPRRPVSPTLLPFRPSPALSYITPHGPQT